SSRAEMADPLPQAFVLTAIVITMAVTIFMLTLAVIGRDDDMAEHPNTGEERDE
ncbi:MAG: NADH-quinone oxidoreductase subunit K, partial [Brachybacterium sp.]|nr:NADH-quinone oxidoreductase subunit K [Brachybacterium sp.]